MLRSRLLSAEQTQALVHDYRKAGLESAEVALLAYAEKVTLHAYQVTPDDIAALRAHGFADAEILDIALAVGLRCLFSEVLDAVGTEPEAESVKLDAEIRQNLTVGRPIGAGSSTA